MSKRRKILLGIALCLLAGIGGVWLVATAPAIEEPSYRGRKLSEWIPCPDDWASRSTWYQTVFTTEQSNAIAHIGTNAIPCLLEWIQHEPSISHQDLITKSGVWKFVPHLLWRMPYQNDLRSVSAVDGFHLLGTNGAPAIPELSKILCENSNRTVCRRVVWALTATGKESVLPLLGELTNSDPRLRIEVIMALGKLSRRGADTNIAPVVPLLIRYTQDTNNAIAATAADSLGYIGLQPEITIPVLIQCATTNSDEDRIIGALAGLSYLGKQATSAIPMLIKMQQHPANKVRLWSTNALEAISPEMLRNTTPN